MSAPEAPSVTLKPCPFCGSCDVEQRETITDAVVACNNCGSRTGLVWLGASDASNAARMREQRVIWNTRHREAAEAEAKAREAALISALDVALNEIWDDWHSHMDRDQFERHFATEFAILNAARAGAQ